MTKENTFTQPLLNDKNGEDNVKVTSWVVKLFSKEKLPKTKKGYTLLSLIEFKTRETRRQDTKKEEMKPQLNWNESHGGDDLSLEKKTCQEEDLLLKTEKDERMDSPRRESPVEI